MLKNFFKISWRNLIRHKSYSAINIFGLTIGLAVCMFIMSYVGHEMTFDSFHKEKSRIYWIQGTFKGQGDTVYNQMMSFATGPILKLNNPEVETFLRTGTLFGSIRVKSPVAGAKQIEETKFLFADSNFFNFFSFPLLQGSPSEVLNKPFAVVISKKTAEKYFGTANPVGQMLMVNNDQKFWVSGVAKNIPSNSSIDFDFVASISTLASLNSQRIKFESVEVQGGSFSTYILLKKTGDITSFNNSLKKFNHSDNNGTQTYRGVPITDIHLNPTITGESKFRYLNIFTISAFVILLLAVSNYVSMATARSETRAREIGIRKVLGANTRHVATQFFIESALYSIISFVIAFVICVLAQQSLFKLLKINQNFSFFFSEYVISRFFILLLATIVIAAIYPSFVLSAYKPVSVLYGKMSKGKGVVSVRKIFTVFQFTISIVLVICGIAIGKQMSFIRNFDTGMRTSNSIVIPFNKNIGKHYSAFEYDVTALNLFDYISASRYPLYGSFDTYFVPSIDNEKQVSLAVLYVDESFIGMMGLKWSIPPTDSFYLSEKNTAILNQTAANLLNLGAEPIGQSIQLGRRQLVVRGILNDFNYESLKNKIGPMCLSISSHTDTLSVWSSDGGYMYGTLKKGKNVSDAVKQLNKVYNKYDIENVFEYSFTDDTFSNLYENENRLEKLTYVSISITLLIACFSLYGLAMFLIQQRYREIGIRKVMGAKARNIFLILSADFLKVVFIACVISAPIAWLLLSKWLQSFLYRANLSLWIFLLATCSAMLISLMTISFQVARAALQNPIKILRSE